jgi:2-polyprenyl-6-methoxyphenol hydroxylase-like FAD-dependent oxidoreductase
VTTAQSVPSFADRPVTDDRVIVTGAGPVGLVLALGLARRGVPVTVIEREPDLYRAPRAMGYHWSSLFGLDDLGLLDDLKARGFLAHGIQFIIRSFGETLTFPTTPLEGKVSHPYTLTLGQDQFAEIVVKHLAQHDHAEIRWRTSVDGAAQDEDGVAVRLSTGEQLTGAYLVAADGASSRLRPLFGLSFGGMTWPDNFVATNVRYDFSQLGYADNNYLVDPVLGAVIAKVTQDGMWRVTWSEQASLPEEGLADRLHEYLRALLPAGATYEVCDFTRYRMHQRAASSMRAGRVLLAGDSAHATNPTSGFGLVGGLFDSYVLSEALPAVLTGVALAGVLDRYSEDRLTAFWSASSPLSVESKRLVFHSQDLDRLEVDMQLYRRIAADPDMLLNFWVQGSRVETPSVVTGRPMSAGRNTVHP